MIYGLVAAALVIGLLIGYLFAVARTDQLIAEMSEEEVTALGERVRARRSSKGG